MNNLKLYEVSEEYISYINTVEKYVFSPKEGSTVDFSLLEQKHDAFIAGKRT